MSRSTKKGPFVAEYLLKKINELNARRAKTPVKTWSRASTIIPDFVGHTFEVHNGKEFKTGLRDRGHGGPQAGRILVHPAVQGPHAGQERGTGGGGGADEVTVNEVEDRIENR